LICCGSFKTLWNILTKSKKRSKKTIEWRIQKEDKELQLSLSRELNISPVLAQLLINRGLRVPSKAKKFLKADIENLNDPDLFTGMKDAVDRIIYSFKHDERILIYGDYDVDGLTSTALMFSVLKEFTPNIYYYIPNRFQEGYGLNEKAIESAFKNKIKLIITVDCGISSIYEIEKARKYGIDIVITDHHIPQGNLPCAAAVINPKCDEKYPFKELAGVGVSFKIAQALFQRFRKKQDLLNEYLDFVALGSIADSVPLIGENRILIKHGLKMLNQTNKAGLKALIKECKLNEGEITTRDINYALVPRLNAAGRLEDPKLALELLLTESESRAKFLAKRLSEINRNRRDIGDNILREAKILAEKQIKEEDNSLLILSGDHWNQGVIGIIASRLAEEFNRPAIIISAKDGIGKGSGRSTNNFHLYKAIEQCKDILINFGGHKHAAGIGIETKKIPDFRSRMNEMYRRFTAEKEIIPELEIDVPILLNEISFSLINDIAVLEPFGLGNPKPLFCSYKNNIFHWRLVGEKKEHLKLKVVEKGTFLDGIGFKLAKIGTRALTNNKIVDLAFNIEINKWNGAENIQINIKDIKK